jgi:endonuclease YncB( thermonuclease family)
MPYRLLPLLCLLPLFAHAAPSPQAFEGRVVAVADGDTLTVLDSNNLQHKIRVAGIDAPEKGQPFGDRSKQSLSGAVMGKDVRIEWNKQDRYGRYVAKVWVTPMSHPCTTTGEPCPKTLDVGRAQLTVGLAWHFKKYENEQSEEDRLAYAFDEQEARVRKAGLWADADPVPPWVWREGPKDGPIKKADKSGICHTPESPSYLALKHFQAFPSLEACIASGGRPLK